MTDVLVAKLSDMARSRRRAEEGLAAVGADPLAPYEVDDRRRDGVVLNLQHFLEDLLDCCKHLVRLRALGVPKDNREVFGLLRGAGLIDSGTRDFLMKANGLRNVIVHRYTRTDMEIVRRAVSRDIGPLHDVAKQLVRDARADSAPAEAGGAPSP